MFSTVLRKRTHSALQHVLIYAALIAAFGMVIGVSLGLGHAKAQTAQSRIAQPFGVSSLPLIRQACALPSDGDDPSMLR
jgi:hypothetical protein